MARVLFLLAFLFCTATTFAQVRETPAAVKETFTTQYPAAESVEYEDNIVSVQVHFTLNNEKMVAAYTNKGKWKETVKEWNYDQLPDEVKVGYQKSKYADWKVVETAVVYRPGGVERFRIKAEKSDIQKKNLYFNQQGQLKDDSITL